MIQEGLHSAGAEGKRGPGLPGTHALIVAVSNYREINKLPEAVLNDARDIAATLVSPDYCGYDPVQVQVLLDGEATLQEIRNALARMARETQPADTVVIFFSGHGARLTTRSGVESVLLPFDCSRSSIESTSLSEKELSEALRAIGAERLVVLLDACHSGGAASFKGSEDGDEADFGYEEKSLARLAQGTGRVLIASSRASETSLVFLVARNSVFTESLLEALRGGGHTRGDGVIRVFEIFDHVAQGVRRATNGKQHPVFKASDLEDNFPVALDRGGSIKAPSVSNVPSETRGDSWRQLEDAFSDLYPAGPLEQDIWARSGGDVSQIRLNGTGRAQWFSALRTLRQGGGGVDIRVETLIRTALEEFPHHHGLVMLRSAYYR